MAAYAVSRMRFPGRAFIPMLILAMSMFPQISIVGFLFEMFAQVGLINHHLALIPPYIAWTVLIALWINLSYFSQISLELDKAALADGAGRVKEVAGMLQIDHLLDRKPSALSGRQRRRVAIGGGIQQLGAATCSNADISSQKLPTHPIFRGSYSSP